MSEARRADVNDELVERMVMFVRAVATVNPDYMPPGDLSSEARAIVAELPAPVDPDLVEARGILVSELDGFGQNLTFLNLIRNGVNDHYSEVRIALAAIKRGRELERNK